jgi:diguanylate cyclase (GGDEF)-like protein
MKVLIVEDDQQLAEILKNSLKSRYAIDIAHDGLQASQFLMSNNYDLVLLDSSLGAIDGLTLCQDLRQGGNQVLIMLMSSNDSTNDRIAGLDAGADDYVIKPVALGELEARMRALLRRRTVTELPILTWGKLRIETSSCNVFYDGKPLGLTTKEYSIVELLLREKERIFSQRALLDALWPSDNNPRGEETVRTHMKRLRQKLKPVGAIDLIETVYGLGYRLNPAMKLAPVAVPYEDISDGEVDNTPVVTANAVATKTLKEETIAQFWEKQSGRFLQRIGVLDHLTQALQKDLSDQDLRSLVRHDCTQLVAAVGGICFPEALPKVQALGQWLQKVPLKTAAEIQILRQQIALLGNLLEGVRQGNEGRDRFSRVLDNNPERRILMVDPDREYVTELMSAGHRWGLQIVRATSPEAAWDAITRVSPDMLLIDCSEGTNTKSNLALLKQISDRCPKIPICILADGVVDERLGIAKFGGQGFYHKSIPQNTLLDRIQERLPRRQSENFTSGAKILVVDDDRVLLEFLKGILEPWGFQVTICEDSSQCEALIEKEQPDLLVLDLEMPQVHGLELCERLRANANTALLPILVLTAHHNVTTIQKVYSAGADDFVTKPVITPELMTRIFNRLERSELVKQQTERDPLTQLLNRSGSLVRFESMVNRANQAHQPLSLGLVSVESIVQLSRTQGYEASDRLLNQIAEQLLNLSYRDTVISRWDNGEFLVMMPGLTAETGERLLMQSMEAINKEWPGVELAIGVAALPQSRDPKSSTVSSLYQDAVAQLRSM